MTRKLTILSVVATIALVANGLNAQEKSQPCQECPASKHVSKLYDSDSVTLKDGMMLIDGHMVPLTHCPKQTEEKAPAVCPSNCNQCVMSKSSCKSCPHCTTTQSASPAQVVAEMTSKANLPGSTSFMREQNKDLSASRTKLAGQIAIYLANEDHDPDHVQRVIELAMESAADQAHRSAMHGQVGTTSIEIGVPLPSGQPKSFPMASNLKKIPAPKPVANNETELAQQMQMLKAELQASQNVIKLLQKDLQTIAEDVSQLRVESNMITRAQQTTFPGQPKQTWPSQMETAQQTGLLRVKNQYTSTRPNTVDSAANLKRRIRVLENQLALMTSQPNQVQPVGLQTQTGQLLPRANVRTPLVPSVSQQPQTVVYYVGDVMAPPFVSSTLQLMQYLKTNVDPESWDTFADVSITEPSISLEITQTPENHRQIRSILEYIREGKLNYMRKTTRR